MAVNDIFKKVPIEVPNKSGFDMSNEVLATAKVGTLIPLHTDFLLPNDTVKLGVSAEIQLPPMATDFYGRVKAHFETFFVPCRILFGGWQDFIVRPTQGQQYPTGSFDGTKARWLPTLEIPAAQMTPGSLSDYLGYCIAGSGSQATNEVYNPLKYCAYHRIWNDFYRDSRIQAPAFARPSAQNGGLGLFYAFSSLPFYTAFPASGQSDIPAVISGTQLKCADSVDCFALRQRCFGKDYFTNASPLPQAGQPAQVAFGVSNNQGAFSIASLRAANSLQMWLERNNVAGYRYGDQIRAHFGVYPSDAALDRPIYLGRQIIDVYNKSVFQNDGNTTSSNTNNPFSSVGAKYGSPLGVGNGELCGEFTATEHGYLMTIFSLVPDSIYSDVIDRDFWYNKSADFPFPLLQGVGDQEISGAELYGYLGVSTSLMQQYKNVVFGYTQRYADFKFKLDRVHGLLKDSQTLQNFALQRNFAQGAALGSSFLEIPTTYLDDVAAVQGDVSKYGCWIDANFRYHKVSTLSAYSIPTLGEPKNTHTEVIPNGGTRL